MYQYKLYQISMFMYQYKYKLSSTSHVPVQVVSDKHTYKLTMSRSWFHYVDRATLKQMFTSLTDKLLVLTQKSVFLHKTVSMLTNNLYTIILKRRNMYWQTGLQVISILTYVDKIFF